jgi:hypothetical protein
MSTPITAAQYRAMAESARTGRSFKREDGSLNIDMLNANRVGAAQAVMGIAADDLEDGRRSPAKVAAWLREQLAEQEMSHEDYFALLVQRGQEYANLYDRKAAEIEAQESAQAVAS